MDKKLKKSANTKPYNLLNTSTIPDKQNSYLIPATTTSMPPVTLPTGTAIAKDIAGQKTLQSSQFRSTRQRTNNTKQTAMTQSSLQLNHTINNNTINNQTLMTAKAAACIATPMEQLAAVHAKATSSRNKNEEAITDLKTRIPEIENIFDIHSRIGNGTFSTVLLGTLKKQRNLPENLKRKFAIKHHIPTSHPDRIMKELQCMAKIGAFNYSTLKNECLELVPLIFLQEEEAKQQRIAHRALPDASNPLELPGAFGTDNVVGINCCIRCNESVAFIMPFLAHDRFHDFYSKMDVEEVQFYMKNLLIALRHVHRFNVIHRDVKPSNFLYNRRKRQFLLVDFGLAQQVPASQTNLNLANSSSNKSVMGKLENLALPAAPKNAAGSGCEGKRSREFDDINAKRSGESAVAITGDGEVVSGTAKRLRCTTTAQEQQQKQHQQQKQQQQTPASVKTGGRGAGGGGTTTRAANAVNNTGAAASASSNASIHERKSAVNSRSQQKLRAQGGAECPQQSSTRLTAVGGGVGISKNTTTNTQLANNGNNNNNNIDAKYNTNRNLSTSTSAKCYCYGNPQVCNTCLVKKEIHASRAGTPGYRPPEVLLKYPDQTTAVDIWAAGVIFLSMLSSVYPFFKAPNDYVALAEMITIFGDKTIRKTAYVLDRLVTLSQRTKPLDLRKLCVRFKNRAKFSSPELLKKHQRADGTCEVCKNCDQFFFNCLCLDTNYATEPLDDDDVYPASAYDLLFRLLEINPHKRITADEALRHPFFSESHNNITNNNNNNKNKNNNLTTSNATSSSITTSTAVLNAPTLSLEAVGDSVKKTRN